MPNKTSSRLTFSLRKLLVVIAVVAILSGLVMSYRRATMAELRWLTPTSVEAKALFPNPAIQEEVNDKKEYTFKYYAIHRSIQKLIAALQNVSFRVDEESVVVQAPDASAADLSLNALQAADALPPGSVVIRGRIRDRSGKPVDGAQVDLLGSFVFINCWKTRQDGTFTMALSDENPTVKMQGGYYFRIRHPSETWDHPIRWHTTTFALDLNEPEMVADIVIPQG